MLKKIAINFLNSMVLTLRYGNKRSNHHKKMLIVRREAFKTGKKLPNEIHRDQ